MSSGYSKIFPREIICHVKNDKKRQSVASYAKKANRDLAITNSDPIKDIEQMS
jgi:hypothetical protein